MARRTRKLVVDDPNLSPEANRLLTRELRGAVATDQVREDRAGATRRIPPEGQSSVWGLLGANWILVAITLAALVVIGAILTLVTGSWWALAAACGVHATGTLAVATVVFRVTGSTEHLAPEVESKLQDEGVRDPDQALADLVDRHRA